MNDYEKILNDPEALDIHTIKRPDAVNEIYVWGSFGEETDFDGIYNRDEDKMVLFYSNGQIPSDVVKDVVEGTSREIYETETNRFSGFEYMKENPDGTYDFAGYVGEDSYGTPYDTIEGTFNPDEKSVTVSNGKDISPDVENDIVMNGLDEIQKNKDIDTVKSGHNSRDKNVER